mgnify:CR=1 FL=1
MSVVMERARTTAAKLVPAIDMVHLVHMDVPLHVMLRIVEVHYVWRITAR